MTAGAGSAAPNPMSAAGSDGGTTRSGQRGGLRPDPATALIAIGVCCVVLGGLVAAVTGPLDLAHGSWTAAYLVLVAGVTQCAMGRSRARRPDMAQPRSRDSASWGWAQVGAWNLGNALVICGTLAGAPSVVDFGSVLLVVALVIALHATRPATTVAARSAGQRVSPWADWAYRALLLVLAVSIPVGMVLSHLRHS